MNAETHPYAKIERLERENAELRAVVDRLPRTADGVPVLLRQRVYFLGPAPEREVLWLDAWSISSLIGGQVTLHGPTQHEESDWRWPETCYSTREAAEKARKEAPNGTA